VRRANLRNRPLSRRRFHFRRPPLLGLTLNLIVSHRRSSHDL
jgi:hypothetical protein